jgi:hypothetical protein
MLKQFALYAPVGCAFSLTGNLQFMIYEFIAPDVFKMLEQGRPFVTAVITLLMFKRNQSRSGWCALVVISFAAICYGQMSQLEKAIKEGGLSVKESNNFITGVMLTVVFIFVNSAAGVYSELMLKTDKHLPFFIQKFYFEVPGTLFGFLLAWQGNDWLVDIGLKKPARVSMIHDGPFVGWNNHWVILCFAFYVIKSWGAGMLVKMMSSLAKQLCSIVSVGALYFFALVHLECADVNTFFCPEAFWPNVSVSMVIADFCVLGSVTSYALAQRDKSRKLMYREQVQEAKNGNEQLKGADAQI